MSFGALTSNPRKSLGTVKVFLETLTAARKVLSAAHFRRPTFRLLTTKSLPFLFLLLSLHQSDGIHLPLPSTPQSPERLPRAKAQTKDHSSLARITACAKNNPVPGCPRLILQTVQNLHFCFLPSRGPCFPHVFPSVASPSVRPSVGGVVLLWGRNAGAFPTDRPTAVPFSPKAPQREGERSRSISLCTRSFQSLICLRCLRCLAPTRWKRLIDEDDCCC